MQKCRIILIDDDNDELEFLRTALEHTGKVFVQASCCDYNELMTALKEPPLPDLIVCDVQMPGRTGIDICRHLQDMADYRHIPIALLSGSQPSRSILEAVKTYKVTDIFVKPENFDGYRDLANRLIIICDKASTG